MKMCRITHPELDGSRYAIIEASNVYPFSTSGFPLTKSNPGSAGLSLDEVKLLAPVEPSKIVCVGRNYLEHAAELGNKMPDEPLLFLKAPSALIASGAEIELPSASQQV